MLSLYPWIIEDGRYIRDANQRKIASLAYARHTISHKVPEEERASNVKAMAIAPELLILVARLAGTPYSAGYSEIASLIDEARILNKRLDLEGIIT